MDPARIFTESLTPCPELENNRGQSQLGGASCRSSHVRNAPLATVGPKKGLMQRSKQHRHSITSSARNRNVSGIVRPSAFAVVRLTISSNLVGCSTGRSAGFAPCRILST